MKTPLLAVRRCTIAISLIHLAIFASYFVPYIFDPQESLWQVLIPPWNGLFAFDRDPSVIIACLMFIPLVLPVCASWAATRLPTRLLSLVGMWISLPLIFLAWFFWAVLALELYAPSSGLGGILKLALFVPPLGLALSSLFCLLLTRYQRRLFEIQEAAPDTSQSDYSSSAYDEDVGHSPTLKKETRSAYTGAKRFLPGPALFTILTSAGLLCQLLVLLSLSLSYTRTITYDPSVKIFHTTGWQVFGLQTPSAAIAFFLLIIPLLPVLASLLYRLPVPLERTLKETLLEGSISFSYWLNMLCFLLSSIVLVYSLLFVGADVNQGARWLEAAFGIPSAALLVALICSGYLRGYLLQRRLAAQLASAP
ncbi:MAG TPA: hypothetical protein VN729_06995 [Ktedonobacteraceae bacterium]|nr:hypothetical protein [Ktedonobacteraceae bacterium]